MSGFSRTRLAALCLKEVRQILRDPSSAIIAFVQPMLLLFIFGTGPVKGFAVSLTVGVVASLYAGYLNPEFRVTASQLSAVVNGFATILLFALIDPQGRMAGMIRPPFQPKAIAADLAALTRASAP